MSKVADLLETMRAQPETLVWSADEVARIMVVPKGNLPAYLRSSIDRGLLHSKIDNGRSFFSLQPFPKAVPKEKLEPAFVPPRMNAPRGDTGNVPRAPLPAPIATHAPEPLPPPASELELEAEQIQARIKDANDGFNERRRRAAAPQPEEEAEPQFDARHWLDGDLDLFGLLETEDGAHRIKAENVLKLRKLLAWLPC